MDVTINNFTEIFPEIKDAIERASFFSIDGEFTGISSEYNISHFDTPEDYYIKTCESSSGFILIQLGLTAFFANDTKFTYKSFNFYVYPRSKKHVFECQGESMSFLAKNGFDFNKLFREGITYCNLIEAAKLKEDMLEKQKQRAAFLSDDISTLPTLNLVPVPEEQKDFLDDLSDQIEDFITSDEKQIIICNRNGFQRKLIYQLIEEKFNQKISISTRMIENNQREIIIEKKKSSEEEKLIEKENIKNEEELLEKNIGLSNVLKLISDSRKLIIGHNMLLDVLYILKQCFGPLPKDYEEFKQFAHEIFPKIIDTKYLCSLDKFKTHINSSILSHIYDSISKEPFSIPEYAPESMEYAYDIKNPKEHNGGYDSFLTGVCFLSMANYLKIKPNDLNASCNALKNKINKIFLLRLQDVNYINLTGKEPQAVRNHVFHVTFPSTWKQTDIVNHFRNFGSIFVSWINDTSAYVALHNRENYIVLLKTIGYTSGVKIMSFKDYKASIIQKLTDDSTFSQKRKLEDAIVEKESKSKKRNKSKKVGQYTDTNTTTSKNTTKMFKENDVWVTKFSWPSWWRLREIGISRCAIFFHVTWNYILYQWNKFVNRANMITARNN